jgi:ABC-2 type transport system ATP-binding protein
VGEVLEETGLAAVAGRRTGGFSLGMAQRLGIAAALLGDPGVLVLDEPVNGLDPEGIRWARTLMRSLAAEGRTVLVSSHLMSEMERTADHLVVIGRGRLLADLPLRDLVEGAASTLVRAPDAARLAAVLTGAIGDLAAAHAIGLHELTPRRSSLEEAYMTMTGGSVEYRAGEVPA